MNTWIPRIGIALLVFAVGCNRTKNSTAITTEDALGSRISRDLAEVAKRQSSALTSADIKVHEVFQISVDQETSTQSVVVDVQFIDFGEGFDLDDLEVFGESDATTQASVETIQLLRDDGKIQRNDAMWESDATSVRVLVTCRTSIDSKAVQLVYWGRPLLDQPLEIAPADATGLSDRYEHSTILPGVRYWTYEGELQYGKVWQHSRWLIARLGSDRGAMVIDCEKFPPQMTRWPCNLIKDIQPSPDGGWIVVTRTGRTRDDIQFPVWHHPTEEPGTSTLNGSSVSPDPEDHFRGLVVLGNAVIVFNDREAFQFDRGKLTPVKGISRAVGVTGEYSTSFTHGKIRLATGEERLIWDGDAYELTKTGMQLTWKLGIHEESEFACVSAGDHGIYYLQDRRVFRATKHAPAKLVWQSVENVMGIRRGPEGTILFELGNNDAGHVAGVWLESSNQYIFIQPQDVSDTLSSGDFNSLHWVESTQTFYLMAREGFFTIPATSLLK